MSSLTYSDVSDSWFALSDRAGTVYRFSAAVNETAGRLEISWSDCSRRETIVLLHHPPAVASASTGHAQGMHQQKMHRICTTLHLWQALQ